VVSVEVTSFCSSTSRDLETPAVNGHASICNVISYAPGLEFGKLQVESCKQYADHFSLGYHELVTIQIAKSVCQA